MSFREYVEIVATWHHDINKKQYDCKNQVSKMKDSARIQAHKNRNGCNKIQSAPRQVQGIVQYHNCYCDHLHIGFDHLVYLQGQYENGMLPYMGSLSEQPNKVIEIIKLIERLKLDRELKIQEAQARKGVK
jgi:hypothetical protein